MPKSHHNTDSSDERRKKFPIRCIKCGELDVRPAVIHYETAKNQDGKLYGIRIPELQVNRCDKCGEVYFGTDADAQINAALREQLGLLTPDQIRDNLRELDLSQKVAADQLGVAPETISRWLSGAMIQSRAMDNLLRVFFGCSEARKLLSGSGQDRSFGARVTGMSGSHVREQSRPVSVIHVAGHVRRSEHVAKFRGGGDTDTLQRSLSFQLVTAAVYAN